MTLRSVPFFILALFAIADGAFAITFTVDTLAPEVAITKGPEARSHSTNPTFEGTASEETEVTVHIKLGQSEVATAKTKAVISRSVTVARPRRIWQRKC